MVLLSAVRLATGSLLVVALFAGFSQSGDAGLPDPSKRARIAYTASVAGLESSSWIEISDLAGNTRRVTSNPQGRRLDDQPVLSPNGKRVAFARKGLRRATGVYVANADGSSVRRILATHRQHGISELSWSPDGRRLVLDRFADVECHGTKPFNHRLTIVDVGTKRTRDLRAFRRPSTLTRLTNVQWAPDGRHLLYIAYYETQDDDSPNQCFHYDGAQLYTVDVDGRNPRKLVPRLVDISAATWSPNGRQIAFIDCYDPDYGCDLGVVGADGKGMRIIAKGQVDASFEGNLLWLPGTNELVTRRHYGPPDFLEPEALFAYPVRGESPRMVVELAPSSDVALLGFSSDGQLLAYATDENFEGDDLVHVVNTVGSADVVDLPRPTTYARYLHASSIYLP